MKLVMKLFLFLFFSIYLFFTGFSSVLMASRPATKIIYSTKNENPILIKDKIENEIIFISDSIQTQIEKLPEKPKKNGLGMIIGGLFLALLGFVFGIGLLLIFLLGFTIGSGFYFKDIYAIAGVMLSGLVIFGLGVYMISRGRERWKEYKRYKKELKRIQKAE